MRNRLRFLSLLLMLMLAACGGTPSTHYYVLDAEKPARPPALGNHVSVVLQVELPRYLDRSRMVSRDSASQLHIAENHQWGGQLRENIARTLADDLSSRLGSANIGITPLPANMQARLTLIVNVLAFERMADGHVHLHVQWHLLTADKTVHSRIEELQGQHNVEVNDYETMAVEMSHLLAELADHIAEAIRQIT